MYWIYIIALIYYACGILNYLYLEFYIKKNTDNTLQFESLIETSTL
jgi:hypothetical protein